MSKWLRQLQPAARVQPVKINAEHRWLGSQDLALYRDLLGVVPPVGLSELLLQPVPTALSVLANGLRAHP